MKVVASLLLTLLTQLSTVPPRVTEGMIEGIVRRVGTSEPIPGAQIKVSRVLPDGKLESSGPPLITTDRDGIFTLSPLEPGGYVAVAAKEGFAQQIYGVRTPGIPITADSVGLVRQLIVQEAVLKLGSGQKLSISFMMTPSGVVTGRVSGSKGEPAVDVEVQLLSKRFDENGRQPLRAQASVATNDRGEYRFSGVDPGQYYVSAVPWASVHVLVAPDRSVAPTPRVSTPDSALLKYSMTHYPMARDIADASFIKVRPGEELNGIDITLVEKDMQIYRVRGNVIDGLTGLGPPRKAIQRLDILPRDVDVLNQTQSPQITISDAGAFELSGVSRGKYWLQAVTNDTNDNRQGKATPTLQSSAIMAIDVRSDMDGIILNVLPPMSLHGRVRSQSNDIVQFATQLRVQLDTERIGAFSMNRLPPPSLTSVGLDGSFTIINVYPGEYRLKLNGLPAEYYVAEAKLGNINVLHDVVSMVAQVSDSLDVRVSGKSGTITGRVVTEPDKSVPNCSVVLMPTERKESPDLYKIATTNDTGHFVIQGIPPGDYDLLALEALEPFAYFDLEFRAGIKEITHVSVTESSLQHFNVKLVLPAGMPGSR